MRRLKFQLQQQNLHNDGFVWETVSELWGHLMSRHHKLEIRAGVEEQIVTHMIRLHYHEGIRPGMRFLRGTRIFEILTVNDVGERQRRMDCLCSEQIELDPLWERET